MTANPEVVADGVRGALGVVQKPVMPRVVEQLVKYVAARRAGHASGCATADDGVRLVLSELTQQ